MRCGMILRIVVDLLDGGGKFEFQPINSNGSQLSRCHNCGAQTKGSYENCPVCGEKTGESLAVTKTEWHTQA